jgi:hypothetical protein
MITYIKHIRDGVFQQFNDVAGRSIPDDLDNVDCANMMQEVADGLAEIIEVDDTPVPTVDDLRIAGYGSIGDQLDEIYHDIDAWRVRIKAVKDNNPKG